MNRLACIGLLVGAALTVAGPAFAQYRGEVREDDRVRPRWNQLGSAVCPEFYDFHRGWCRPRDGGRLPPQWNSQGSAVCPPSYVYHQGRCRPHGQRFDGPGLAGREYRYGPPPQYGHGGPALVRPRWNRLGSAITAVCPEYYDYYQGWCRARAQDGAEASYENGRPATDGSGEGIPPQWNSQGQAVCPDEHDYAEDIGLCVPRQIN
jgi:hypothetical protein